MQTTTPEPKTVSRQHSDAVRRRVEELVHEMAQLARSELPPERFYRELLTRMTVALGAHGGIVWLRDSRQSLAPAASLEAAHAEVLTAAAPHADLLQRAVAAGEPIAERPNPEEWPPETNNWLLLVAPLSVAGQTIGLLEIVQRGEVSTATADGNLRFLARTTALAHEYLKNRQLEHWATELQRWQHLDLFVRAIHTAGRFSQLAFAIANEGRTVAACDRLSVLTRDGRRQKLQATSGQAGIDRRSNVVRRMEAAATLVARARRTVSSQDDPAQLAAPLAAAFAELTEETDAAHCTLMPLVAGPHDPDSTGTEATAGELVGVLVAEWFDAPPAQRERGWLERVARHASAALYQAQQHRGLLPGALRRGLAMFGIERLPKTLFVFAALAAAVTALAVVPARFSVEGHGTLEPAVRRDVFAAVDGVVRAINVKHLQHVDKGAVLLRLTNDELELKRAALEGERQKLQATIDALSSTRTGQWSAEDRSRHASQLRSLKQSLAGLAEQLELLNRRAEALDVTSPLTGEVITWDVENLLRARPVSRGHLLLSVADTTAPWRVEVPLPEQRLGHVVAAFQQAKAAGQPLNVEFVLATNPEHSYTGRLEEIAGRADVDPQQGNTVRLIVSLDRSQIPAELLRAGAAATVKVDCGQRSAGYVWFHDVWEWYQREVAFRLK